MEKLGSDEAERLRKQAEKENLAKELLKERIRDNTWGRMEVNSRVISAMVSENTVYNYGIRKLG